MAAKHVRPRGRGADPGPFVSYNRDTHYHPRNELRRRRTRRDKQATSPTGHSGQRVTPSDTQFRCVSYRSQVHCVLARVGTQLALALAREQSPSAYRVKKKGVPGTSVPLACGDRPRALTRPPRCNPRWPVASSRYPSTPIYLTYWHNLLRPYFPPVESHPVWPTKGRQPQLCLLSP